MHTRPLAVPVALMLAAVWAMGGALAGPLNPPVGPVAPTAKPLAEVEPRTIINEANTPGDADSLFKITQPGSYYLTGNLTGAAARHGIEVAAAGVTIDLNGFELIGVAGSLDGVTVSANGLANLTVRNGTVRNWGDEGIDLRTISANYSTVRNVQARANAGSGIAIGDRGRVIDCTASANGSDGIVGGSNCVVRGCVASDNTGNGITVFLTSTVTGCAASVNTADGIQTASSGLIADCSTSDNGGNGLQAGSGSTITNCTATDNTSDGINANVGNVVTGCTAYSNTANGIRAQAGSIVSNCAARANTTNGIQVTAQCTVLNNVCASNANAGGDGAGVHATGSDNRIEGNNCTTATRGIDVDSAGNIIIRNTASGNTTNWSIVANNVFGPIIDRSAPASAAVSGSAAAGTMGSTDPNANFTF